MKRRSSQSSLEPVNPPTRAAFTSVYGSVRVYTRRHINGCPLLHPDQQHCPCPKWIYSKARGAKAKQEAAGTPSYTEACGLAQKKLKGFDPEIAAARAIVAPVPGISIEAALDRFFEVQTSRQLSPSYLRAARAVFYRRCEHKHARRERNLSFLDFLDIHNRAATDPILRMEQLSRQILDGWTSHWRVNDMTAKLWRTTASSFLKWAFEEGIGPVRRPLFSRGGRLKPGNRCGDFTDDQYARLRNTLPFYRPQFGPALPAHYAERLGAFLDLGRWAGMAIADIVRFNPTLALGTNNVITYRRRKTGQVAQILLDPAVAAGLRSIPAEEGSDPVQPFRFPESDEITNGKLWRERFQKLCAQAGITEIETETGTRRKPHPHMLRDTFAIDAITRGVSLDNVAKMLGHATIEITQKSYLFWIEKRLDHSIEDQRAALARVQVAPIASSAADGENRIGVRIPLVH